MKVDEEKIQLTRKQQLFCEEYIKDFNASRAARVSGYSEESAGTIGWENLKKPEIDAEIKRLLTEARLSKEQTEKLVSDIAQSSINDFMIVRKEWITKKVPVPLAEYIQDLKNDMSDEVEAFLRYDSVTKQEEDGHRRFLNARKKEIIKLEVQLERDPEAVVKVTKDVEIEITELDLKRLQAEKEKGRIKSFKMDEDGVKVELFAADAALRDLLKIHGSYAPEKKEHSGPDGKPLVPDIDLTKLTDEQLKRLSELQLQSRTSQA